MWMLKNTGYFSTQFEYFHLEVIKIVQWKTKEILVKKWGFVLTKQLQIVIVII